MSNRIERAIDIFLDAINSGTLAKGICSACAVGNLVAHGMGAKVIKTYRNQFTCDVDNMAWRFLFITTKPNSNQTINLNMIDNSDVIKCIDATEFSWEELAAIENAFEKATRIPGNYYDACSNKEIRQDQIEGLSAVIKVMESFEKDIKPDTYVNEFISKVKLIPV